MKRIAFILMTIALVASCTKTEIRYDEPNQISFTPVAKVSTKAAVESTYPVATLPLHVWANAGDKDADKSAFTSKYFENFTFTAADGAQVLTNSNAYWPNEKYLVFAGVSASGNVGATTDPATLAMDFSKDELTITSYTQPKGESVNNDLMWFPTTTPQGKPASDAAENVTLTMLHACALLKFNFIADAEIEDWNIKIKTITVNDLVWSGDAVCGTTSANWTVSTTASKETVTVYSRTAEGTTDAEKAVYTVKCADDDATTNDYITPETVADNTIVIPQTPGTLSVTYEFTTSANATLTETVTVPLSIGKETVEGVEVEKKWQSGYRYTYNITMGAGQIKIAPTASTWGDYDANPSTTDVADPIEKNVQ